MSGRTFSCTWLLGLLVCASANASAQMLAPGAPIAVRILYDNSGSMYPGYRPPGAPERKSRTELGVGFFHESPRFAIWLDSFAKRQTIVDGATIGMWTFTSFDRFTPSDIREVHPTVPLARFDASAAIRNFPQGTGNHTYLTETIDAFTRGFTGLVWLITDNIVESNEGQPDSGVQTFFQTLAARREIRAVHLYKYTFEDRGQSAAIAVYGILVSAGDVQPSAIEYYDGKFRVLRDSKATTGNPPPDLFPGRDYLKLKDLRIGIVRPELRLILIGGEQDLFKEGQTVQLSVQGAVRSLLTQHTVTRGHYELEIETPFTAEEWAQRELGAEALEPEQFEPFSGDLAEPIPPEGSQSIEGSLQSLQPVSFSPRGIGSWLRLAWSGATVRYTATLRMSFSGINVRLEPRRMAGIFGIDRASSAFAFQDVKTLAGVPPARVPVSFVLRTGNSRTILLLLSAALLAAAGAALGFFLSRKRTFRIAVSKEPERIVALGPAGHYDVVIDGRIAGRLTRRFGRFRFRPATNDAGVTVTQAKEGDSWDVHTSGTSRRLSIRADGLSQAKPASGGASTIRAAPAPPPSPRSAAPPPLPGRPNRSGHP